MARPDQAGPRLQTRMGSQISLSGQARQAISAPSGRPVRPGHASRGRVSRGKARLERLRLGHDHPQHAQPGQAPFHSRKITFVCRRRSARNADASVAVKCEPSWSGNYNKLHWARRTS